MKMKCENCSYWWYDEYDEMETCHADEKWPAPCEESGYDDDEAERRAASESLAFTGQWW